MLKKLNSNMMTAIMFIFISIVYFIESLKMAPPFVDGKVSMTFFPYLISIMTFVISLIILFRSLKEKRGMVIDRKRVSRSFAVVVMTFLFVMAFEKIGYVVSSLVYCCSLMMIFGQQKQKMTRNVLYAGLVVLVVYVLFEKIFGVKLPMMSMEG